MDLCQVMRNPVTTDEVITRNVAWLVNQWVLSRRLQGESATWRELARQVREHLPEEDADLTPQGIVKRLQTYLGQRFDSADERKTPWRLDYLQALLTVLGVPLSEAASPFFDAGQGEAGYWKRIAEDARELSFETQRKLLQVIRRLRTLRASEECVDAFEVMLQAQSVGDALEHVARALLGVPLDAEKTAPAEKNARK